LRTPHAPQTAPADSLPYCALHTGQFQIFILRKSRLGHTIRTQTPALLTQYKQIPYTVHSQVAQHLVASSSTRCAHHMRF
jgi:hypothetical protein